MPKIMEEYIHIYKKVTFQIISTLEVKQVKGSIILGKLLAIKDLPKVMARQLGL